MTQYIATVIDTTGIQSYIFGSNRLRENVGASYLVGLATDGKAGWVKYALEQLGIGVYVPNKNIEDGETSAELVYSGGGNAVLLFKNTDDLAIRFTRILSKKVLLKAPGLKIVVAHSEPFSWGDKLSDIIDNLIGKELDRKKREYNPSNPLLGVGVTANCNSTGLVAVDNSDRYGIPKRDSYLVSQEIVAKLKTVDKKLGEPANQKLLDTIFDDLDLGDYHIPLDVDDMGRTERENSYLAIVHADGNDMGDRFKNCGRGKPDRQYIDEVRELSEKVQQAGIKALKAVARQLIKVANQDKTGDFPITLRDGKKYLPFRPLVYGGDDVIFVCDGRLGLSLAALFLEKFQNSELTGINDLTACAGIAIVKTHYPFARAYQLSEALYKNAKKFMRDESSRLSEPHFSALDWHIAASGLMGSIGEIRQREYQVTEGNLTPRPIRLRNSEESEQSLGNWRTWETLANLLNYFNLHPDWAGRHNKVVNLREQLRQGSVATKKFIEAYGLKNLPIISDLEEQLQQFGWIDIPKLDSGGERVCGYFDAIEAMEFYIPLGE